MALLTLRESLATYLRDNHTIQESTKRRTQRAFLPFVMLKGDVEIERVTRADVVAYQGLLIKAGKSVTTTNSYSAQVSAVFGWFVSLGLLAHNPFTGVRRLREPRREVTYYETPEVERLLAAIDELKWRDPTDAIRLRGILLVAYHAGLRIGEIQNLRWLDIDLEQAVVKVQYRPCKPGAWWEWGSKGFADRVVPMSQELLDHMYRMQVVCPWMYPFLPVRRCRALQQRATTLAEPIRKGPYNNLYRRLDRIRRMAGIDGAFHKLRRTFATDLSPEVSPTDLQRLMGHQSFSTTLSLDFPDDAFISM